MILTPKAVFLELHKTGGTHIGRLMQEFLGGEREGKHNRLPLDYSHRYVFGSVRNPWDWYVSLWGYGCLNRGSVYRQTTNRIDLGYYFRELNKEVDRNDFCAVYAAKQLINDLCYKSTSSWSWCYEDVNDPKRFQVWLSMLLEPRNALDVREGYGLSYLYRDCGLMTYRFLKLFSRSDLYSNRAFCYKSLCDEWSRTKLTRDIIKNEELETGFVSVVEKAGHVLSDEQKKKIVSGSVGKTNTSERHNKDSYYTQELIDLVETKERFIVDLFGYRF